MTILTTNGVIVGATDADQCNDNAPIHKPDHRIRQSNCLHDIFADDGNGAEPRPSTDA